jgi:hypothetical protein
MIHACQNNLLVVSPGTPRPDMHAGDLRLFNNAVTPPRPTKSGPITPNVIPN